MSDTIAAIATGAQFSAIGIIRISGPDTLDIIDKAFKPQNGRLMSHNPDRTLIYGELLSKSGKVLDICLCTISRAPASYTGENTAELQCHGSPTVLFEALETLFKLGARQALPGEFSKRSFLNGRMDLTQAEAVIDLINSETAEAAQNAAGQLAGAIFRKTQAIYDNLINISAHYHAILDYPDEDIEEFSLKNYHNEICLAIESMEALLSTYRRGKIMQRGVTAAILGKPNAGKSSLLNALLGYDRVIVTDIPGTTRDTIEVKLHMGSVLLRLSDTAGLRLSNDPVEQLGIDRAVKAAEAAELVIAVFDLSSPLSQDDDKVISAAKKAESSIAVLNKCDLPQKADIDTIRKSFPEVYMISAKTGSGLSELTQAVSNLYPLLESLISGEILTNARQAEAITLSLNALKNVQSAIAEGMTADAVLSDLDIAMNELGRLTGKTLTEDVTSRIFGRFCVGK